MERTMETARYELPNLLRARAEECRTLSPAGAPLMLAAMVPVYDVEEIEQRLAGEGMPRSEALRAMYVRMLRAGEMRYVVKPTALSALDELYATCPNFAPVIDDIKKQLALAMSGDQPLSFTPILLLGEPGLGKTHFARSLARALCTACELVPMAS